MSKIAVITDSTAYLPPGWAQRYNIGVVPVQVIIAGQAYDETEVTDASLVTRALEEWKPVSTSRPSPERFVQACEEQIARGASGIVIATLSCDLSATHESAVLAAKRIGVPVSVIDSRSIAMGLGFAAVAGAERALAGDSVDEVAMTISKRASASSVFFAVDTLEYLRRGGRVTSAKAVVGQALSVKPILQVVDGHVVQLEKVRTSTKAISRLIELAIARAGSSDVEFAVQHLAAADRAATVADTLASRLPHARIVEAPVGGVVGAHVGPGLVAVIVAPRV